MTVGGHASIALDPYPPAVFENGDIYFFFLLFTPRAVDFWVAVFFFLHAFFVVEVGLPSAFFFLLDLPNASSQLSAYFCLELIRTVLTVVFLVCW